MIDDFNISALKKIAKILKVSRYTTYKKRNKDELIKRIKENFSDKEISSAIKNADIANHYITNDWARLGRLGMTGKDGKCFLVVNTRGETYAMKVFKKNKSSNSINREVEFQRRASSISPQIIEVNAGKKYIVMERMDCMLYDILKEQKGRLTPHQQMEIIQLFKKLDDLRIFHNDISLTNIAFKEGKFYMIDYGFSVTTSHKDIAGIKNPNVKFMSAGLLMSLKMSGYNVERFTEIRKYVHPKILRKISLM